jgi:hypothetical protein
MNIDTSDKTVYNEFFAPLHEAYSNCESGYSCDEFTDNDYLESGVSRVIGKEKSGRGYVLQRFLSDFLTVKVATFFKALRSKRRLKMLSEVSELIIDDIRNRSAAEDDPFIEYEDLKKFAVYASDGVEINPSIHDDKTFGRKWNTKHIFSINLRNNATSHIALSVPDELKKKEHEIKTLKRAGSQKLRMREKKGIKVIHVYDRAIIDYRFLYNMKQSSGIYFTTLQKSKKDRAGNDKTWILCENIWDKHDKRNKSIISDEMIELGGFQYRRIKLRHPNGKTWPIITNEFSLEPGVIAFLYVKRWDIEKRYDEFKNGFLENRAWAKTDTAKEQQALFMTTTLNLILLFEMKLKKEENITDRKIIKRRLDRTKAMISKVDRVPISSMFSNPFRCTQRSQQFLGWLRHSLEHLTCWQEAINTLRPLMLNYLT